MMQENNSEWGFHVVVFLRIKTCFKKKRKTYIKKQKKQVVWFY